MRRDGIAHPGAQTGGKARNRGGMRRSMAGRRAVRMGMVSGAACAMPGSMRAEADGKQPAPYTKNAKGGTMVPLIRDSACPYRALSFGRCGRQCKSATAWTLAARRRGRRARFGASP